VDINPNLETFTIVERFAYPYSNIFKFRDSLLKAQPIERPMVEYAYQYFKGRNNKVIAQHMSLIVDTIIASRCGGQDAIFYALLHAKDFPNKGYKTKPYDVSSPNPNLPKATRDFLNSEVSKLVEELRVFYINENVAKFIKTYKYFYDGAINEIKSTVPTNTIDIMEKYYRVKNNDKYTIYLMPTRPFTKGEWQGNAHKIEYENGQKETIQIMSSSYLAVPFSKKNKYTAFGFNDKNWVQELTIHEFGHTFCKFSNDQNLFVEESNFLLSDSLRESMKNQGYLNWRDIVNEHIVRTGEIRIAKKMGDTTRASKLLTEYISKRKFILIPKLENEMKRFEDNSSKYPTFQVFLTELISFFKTITTQERDKLWLESIAK
jgi:Domain of unknown function (DUF4932)